MTRQDEPIAVTGEWGGWQRPETVEDADVGCLLYSDGDVFCGGIRVQNLDQQIVRQVLAQLEFGWSGRELLEWSYALERANAKREAGR